VGLRNKQHCILNKQYSKEEYDALLPRVRKWMSDMAYQDASGTRWEYGDFFPADVSPFCYNETVAQELFPLTREEAASRGVSWRVRESSSQDVTVGTAAIPDHIDDAADTITKEILACAHEASCNHQCAGAFRVIPSELQLYKTMRIPLPVLCPNCRHYERIAMRNPLILWERECACEGLKSRGGSYANQTAHDHGDSRCTRRFETPYDPRRREIVYCEQCYQAEIS
jgi:hypothetical protein